MMAGTRPSRTSVNEKLTDAAATTRSHAANRPTPPARASPFRRHTTGCGQLQIFSKTAGNAESIDGCAPDPAAARCSLRSAPELNTGPAPVSTSTRLSGCADAPSMAPLSSETSLLERALRLCGESRVIVAMPSATSYRTSGSSTETPPTPQAELTVASG